MQVPRVSVLLLLLPVPTPTPPVVVLVLVLVLVPSTPTPPVINFVEFLNGVKPLLHAIKNTFLAVLRDFYNLGLLEEPSDITLNESFKIGEFYFFFSDFEWREKNRNSTKGRKRLVWQL